MASFTSEDRVFVCGGGREMVSLEKLQELLIPMQSIDDPLILRMSNKSFSYEAAEAIAKIISNFNNLEIADISDIIAGRPEDEALKTLSVICNALDSKDLIEVNLSDNALGSKGVNACNGILKGKKMERLYLCNNGLSAEACELVSTILHEGGCPPLKVLNFYNNMSGDGGAKAVSCIVKDCPQLTNFRFSATRSGASGCLSMSQALASLSHLTHLDLSDNTFDKAAALALADALGKQSQLTHLNLRDCGLGEEGAAAVLRAVARIDRAGSASTDSNTDTGEPSPLVLLDLSANDMTCESMGVLSAALPRLQALRDLYLDDNELATEGVTVLATALKKSSNKSNLRLLSLETCEVTAAGAIRTARAVSRIRSFETLRLNGNMVCSNGLTVVTETLTTSGKMLGETDDNDDDGDDDVDDVEEDEEEEEEEEDVGVEVPSVAAPAPPAAIEAPPEAQQAIDIDDLSAALAKSTI